jgi:sporulation protein YlmC with PRC-barrel domain
MRANELIGRPVVTAATGERVGRIDDVLLNDTGRQTVGVLVSNGLLSTQRIVPIADVQTVGTDAVIVQRGSHATGAHEWLQGGHGATRSRPLVGKQVVTPDGRLIGTPLEVAVSGRGYRTDHVIVDVSTDAALENRSTSSRALRCHYA